MLKNLRQPTSSTHSDLSERIIKAASYIEQKPSFILWMNRIFREFYLPAPAYSLTSLLFIGFFTGFLLYTSTDSHAFSPYLIEQLLPEGEHWYE